MSKRKSIEIDGLSHGVNPIPAASLVGNIVVTGGVSGIDTKTGQMPDNAAAQCANMFTNCRRILAAAGATPEDVIKMTVWIKHASVREAVNKEWVAMFPDSHSRPARHTLLNDQLANSMVVQCEVWAVLTGATGQDLS